MAELIYVKYLCQLTIPTTSIIVNRYYVIEPCVWTNGIPTEMTLDIEVMKDSTEVIRRFWIYVDYDKVETREEWAWTTDTQILLKHGFYLIGQPKKVELVCLRL